jgi:GTPase SAR1 family protein
MILTEETEGSVENRLPVLLCPLQIPLKVHLNRTHDSGVRELKLTSQVTAKPDTITQILAISKNVSLE